MTNQDFAYQQTLLREIATIPSEYFPNLLQLIRIFRETVLLSSASQDKMEKEQKRYPLRGLPFTYIDPTEPVALDDWEALQ
ncbi:MAG: hypothetical protein ACTFAL_06370 [Candidatus Electronema sp. V4]|uniref:hypothetical protein n=1 Tax=Candidatus Electronema sp. V4 TaxID=3454756 RepID=UPI0040556E6B